MVDIAVDEIIHFAEECRGKKLDVHIVIPPEDNDVYEVRDLGPNPKALIAGSTIVLLALCLINVL